MPSPSPSPSHKPATGAADVIASATVETCARVAAVADVPMMAVEVCYVPPLPAAASLITVTLASGSTVFDAICASGVLARYPEIDLAVNQVGVFGKFVSLARVLADFERVEIYRPLKIDPKVARRERVQKVRADSTEGRKWLPKKLPKQQR